MTKLSTIHALSDRYHVKIERKTFFAPFTHEEFESFNIYSADGCCWDRVIGYRSLVRTLASDKDALERIFRREDIKRYVEENYEEDLEEVL